jgi:DNA-binding transcriptional regulator YiaG
MYGTGENAVRLSAEIPAHRCADCGLEFSGEEAERLRHQAVCDYLGLLSPARIAETRVRYDLSRAKFAAISRIGMATLARWESGETLQNPAMDVYVRLLSHRHVFDLVASGAIFEKAVEATKAVRVVSGERFPAFSKLDPTEQARRVERGQDFSLQGVRAA